MNNQEIIQVPFKLWLSSYQEWLRYEGAVTAKVPFYNNNGWKDWKVIKGCGYCTAAIDANFNEESKCDACSLNKKRICIVDTDQKKSAFWDFIREMVDYDYDEETNETEFDWKKESFNIDWEKALRLVRRIRRAFENDGKKWGYING